MKWNKDFDRMRQNCKRRSRYTPSSLAMGERHQQNTFLKFKEFNTSKTNNWNKMVDWLNKEANFYETTLRQVMGVRRT